MKIAYFADTFLPQTNGIATSVATLATMLGAQGHQVVIFVPKSPRASKFKAKNVEVIYIPSVPAVVYPDYRLTTGGFFKVMKKLRDFDPDIIHFHSPFTTVFEAVAAGKLLKKPIVGTNHTFLTKNNREFFSSVVKNRKLLRFISSFAVYGNQFIYSLADLNIVPSRLLIDELRKDGYKKPMVQVLNPIIPQDEVVQLSEKEKEKMKKKYGLRKKVLLHYGRVSREKSIDTVIKAFAEIAKKDKDVSLLIIGEGPAMKELKKLCVVLKVSKSVVFTGAIAHNKLMKSGIISVADCFATASTTENQSMVLIEAMSYGLPIVAVGEAGILEEISGNGYLVKKGDYKDMAEKILKILHNPKIALKMKEKSLSLVQRHYPESVSKALLTYYQKLSSGVEVLQKN